MNNQTSKESSVQSKPSNWFTSAIHNVPTLYNELIMVFENALQRQQHSQKEFSEESIRFLEANFPEDEHRIKLHQDLSSISEKRITYDIPRLYRESIFIMTMAFLEDILNEACEFIAETENRSLRPKDMQGRGIERSRKYLKDYIGVNFPDEGGSSWAAIKRFQEIRNVFVHRFGKVRDDQVSLIKYILSREGMGLDTDGRIVMGEFFLFTTLYAVGEFLEAVDDRIREYNPTWQEATK
jgi:hypothetical protein